MRAGIEGSGDGFFENALGRFHTDHRKRRIFAPVEYLNAPQQPEPFDISAQLHQNCWFLSGDTSMKEPVIASGADLVRARGLFYLIVGGVIFISLVFILAGLGLVYLGASGDSTIKMLGLEMTSSNVGIISIALGAISMIIVVTKAMHHIQEILRIPK